MLNGCGSAWAPKNLNIATPRNGLHVFLAFLRRIGYQLNSTGILRNEAAGALTHSEYINPNQNIVTVTKGKERDSFLGIILGSNHTAVMNFISSNHCCALYPTETLKQQITYVYRYPPLDMSELQLKNFTIVTDSTHHPTNPPLCCPNMQRQFTSYSGFGLFEWNSRPNPDNLLSRSYTWRLGDVCLRESCATKRMSLLLVRTNSQISKA